MIAYLPGGMEHANNYGAACRKDITQWLDASLEHSAIDPVIESKKLIAENNAKDFRNWKETDPDKFIEFIRLAIKKDLDGIVDKSDYIICLWDKSVFKGRGTHGEFTLAHYSRKPIYLVLYFCLVWLGFVASNQLPILVSHELLMNHQHTSPIHI